ncbi:hypothetical protein AA0243_0878 [Novacetimonas hansenii NRIC 0243]|nr:hypothetical protein AA0243_0878 [Novacetimonas hansenii NRIC 0243]
MPSCRARKKTIPAFSVPSKVHNVCRTFFNGNYPNGKIRLPTRAASAADDTQRTAHRRQHVATRQLDPPRQRVLTPQAGGKTL